MTQCQRKGCRARLAHNNKTGLCKAHASQCRAEGCEEWVGPESKSKLCLSHRMAMWREEHPRRCCTQCNDTLHHNNSSGLCGRCKSINRQRAMKRCGCGQSLEPRNKSGKCFKCLHPGVQRGSRRHTPKRGPYTVKDLTRVASRLTLTPMAELTGSSKVKRLTRIRFAVWYLAEPHYSYPHIGREFGDRDHSTIMHGCQRASDMLETDKGFAIMLNEIKSNVMRQIERKAA